jgi:hypothetical protein
MQNEKDETQSEQAGLIYEVRGNYLASLALVTTIVWAMVEREMGSISASLACQG